MIIPPLHVGRLRFAWLLGVLGLGLLASGCGRRESRVDRGPRTQALYYNLATEVQDLDPQLVTGVSEHHAIMSLIEGLVTEDSRDLHPVPGVAKSWDISPDQLVYTFHLREDAKWSNGDRVTAVDFVRSYQRMLTPSLAAQYAYMLYPITNAEAFNTGKLKDFAEVGVKAADDATLKILLHHPAPYLLSLMNHMSWFPVHLPTIEKFGKAYERNNNWTKPGNFVGNGAFTLASWRMNVEIVVKKSPTYWDRATVKLHEIHFLPIESDVVEEKAFRSGQVHLTQVVPLSLIPKYQREHPELINISPYLGNYFYRINVTKPPLNDKRVRQALALAIDRESLVKNVTKGGQLPAYHYTPPGTAGYHARARLQGDLAVARRLLAEAGFPKGQGCPPIQLLYNTSEAHRSIAEAIQQMWKNNLNLDVTIVNQEWKVYLDSQKTLAYQICRAGWIADYVDPKSFLDMWMTDGGQNETGWSHKKYDELIRLAEETGKAEERTEYYQQAEAILMDEVPIIPIYFYTRVNLIHPSVKGWHPTILDNHPYKHVYLDHTGPDAAQAAPGQTQ